jgi:hypothetical protein
MDARTYIETYATCRQPTDVALRFGAGLRGGFSRSALAEIFKKTPTLPGLKPRGPDVAQDLREFGVIPFPDAMPLGREARVEGFDAKLTDKESSRHKSEHKLRATNHTSGAMWISTQRVGSVAESAAARAGQVHEKYCDANV